MHARTITNISYVVHMFLKDKICFFFLSLFLGQKVKVVDLKCEISPRT